MVATLFLILIIVVDLASNEPDKRVITTLKYSKKYAHPSVVHGVPAKWGQVPYIVSIKEKIIKISEFKYIWSNICGGTIIGPVKVLTAAHCFEMKNFYFRKHHEKLRVVAGEFLTELIHTGNTETTDHCQWRRIAGVSLHPKFQFPENDIAVVIVAEPWRFQENVNLILPAIRRDIDYPLGCTAAGYGSTAQGIMQRISPVLLVGQVFLMTRKNCSSVWEMNMNNFICTYSYMSDVSQGDSGGPLICKGTEDPIEKKNDPKALLVGVVSGKNFDKTTIFTRVAAYRDWIDKQNSLATRIQLSVVTLLVNYILLSLYVFSLLQSLVSGHRIETVWL